MAPRRMFWASVCFAWAGFLFLAAAPAPFILLLCGAWFVMALYVIGWVHLSAALFVGDPVRGDRERIRFAIAFIVAPLTGFVVSLALVPWLLPFSVPWGVWWFVYGLFLYVPTVSAPILIGHGALFLVAARRVSRFASPFLVVAGVSLLETAVAGVAAQFLWPSISFLNFSIVVAVLPGLTGPAYGLAAIAWWGNSDSPANSRSAPRSCKARVGPSDTPHTETT